MKKLSDNTIKKTIPILCNECNASLSYPENGTSRCLTCGEVVNVELVHGKWYRK